MFTFSGSSIVPCITYGELKMFKRIRLGFLESKVQKLCMAWLGFSAPLFLPIPYRRPTLTTVVGDPIDVKLLVSKYRDSHPDAASSQQELISHIHSQYMKSLIHLHSRTSNTYATCEAEKKLRIISRRDVLTEQY